MKYHEGLCIAQPGTIRSYVARHACVTLGSVTGTRHATWKRLPTQTLCDVGVVQCACMRVLCVCVCVCAQHRIIHFNNRQGGTRGFAINSKDGVFERCKAWSRKISREWAEKQCLRRRVGTHTRIHTYRRVFTCAHECHAPINKNNSAGCILIAEIIFCVECFPGCSACRVISDAVNCWLDNRKIRIDYHTQGCSYNNWRPESYRDCLWHP